MSPKPQQLKTTVRYDARLAPAIAAAARREGMSQNEWIVCAIRAHLDATQREQEHNHIALLSDRLNKLQAGLDGSVELSLAIIHLLFNALPNLDHTLRARLLDLTSLRQGTLDHDAPPRIEAAALPVHDADRCASPSAAPRGHTQRR